MNTIHDEDGLRIIQGESINTLAALHDDGERFDALVTDPPYASGGLHTGTKTQSTATKYVQTGTINKFNNFEGDARSQLGWLTWCSCWLNLCRHMLEPGAPVLMFCDWRQIGAAIQAIEAGGFIHRGVVVWNKAAGRPAANGFRAQSEFAIFATNGKQRKKTPESVYLPGVFAHKTPASNVRRHQTQKPVPLLEDLLRVVPTGGHVLDPFGGSGSTLHAAKSLGLMATAIEEQPAIATDAASWLAEAKTTESR